MAEMNALIEDIIKDKAVRFIPMYFYPELRAAGLTADYVTGGTAELSYEERVGLVPVRSGQSGGNADDMKERACAMARVMKNAVDRLPEIDVSMTALDVTIDPELLGCRVMYDTEAAPHVVSSVVDRKGNGLDLIENKTADAHAGRQDLHYEAIRRFKELKPGKPVFGNLLGPFTMACSVMPLKDAMVGVMKKPDLMHTVLAKCLEHLIARAKAYKEAGADGLLLDEACGGIIPPALSAVFSSSYIKTFVQEIQTPDFPIMYHNCGNVAGMKESLFDMGCRIYQFGNITDLEPFLKDAPESMLITGNLDPMLLSDGSEEDVYSKTLQVLGRYAEYPSFVFSPGCDCPPHSKAENAEAMVRALRNFNGSSGRC